MILEDWDTRIATMIGDCGDQYLIKMRFEPQNWNINDQAAPSSTGWSQHHHTLTSIHHRDLQLDFLGDWFNWTHDTMSSVTSYRHTLIVNLITTCPIEYFFTNLIIDASEKTIIIINFQWFSGYNYGLMIPWLVTISRVWCRVWVWPLSHIVRSLTQSPLYSGLSSDISLGNPCYNYLHFKLYNFPNS